jgi:response regulator RpfG family c-di-GMP phosphodiesterase
MVKRVLVKEGYHNIKTAGSAEDIRRTGSQKKDRSVGIVPDFGACFKTGHAFHHHIHYITKPFNPLELAARIRATLKRTYKREEKTAVKTCAEQLTGSPPTISSAFCGE